MRTHPILRVLRAAVLRFLNLLPFDLPSFSTERVPIILKKSFRYFACGAIFITLVTACDSSLRSFVLLLVKNLHPLPLSIEFLLDGLLVLIFFVFAAYSMGTVIVEALRRLGNLIELRIERVVSGSTRADKSGTTVS